MALLDPDSSERQRTVGGTISLYENTAITLMPQKK